MKKTLHLIMSLLFIIIPIFGGVIVVGAQTTQPANTPPPTPTATTPTATAPVVTKPKPYEPLSNITKPDGTAAFSSTDLENLPNYFQVIFRIGIGIVFTFAFLSFLYAGWQYMGSDIITEKADAKKRLTETVYGVIIALSAYALLYTINPDILAFKDLDLSVNATSTGSGSFLESIFKPRQPGVDATNIPTGSQLTQGQVINRDIIEKGSDGIFALKTAYGGLKAGTKILSVAGQKITNVEQFNNRILGCGTHGIGTVEKISTTESSVSTCILEVETDDWFVKQGTYIHFCGENGPLTASLLSKNDYNRKISLSSVPPCRAINKDSIDRNKTHMGELRVTISK